MLSMEQGDVEKLQNDLRAAQRRVRELESNGVTAGGEDGGETLKISSLGLMDSEWQEREQNLLRQLEDERFRCNFSLYFRFSFVLSLSLILTSKKTLC